MRSRVKTFRGSSRCERKFNRRTKLRRWNSATVWGLVFKVAVDFHRRQLYGRGASRRFRFLPRSAESRVRCTLIWINFPKEGAHGFPPRSNSFPAIATLEPHSSPPPQLSPRRRCRKSRVHFPHFSPSWRAARTTVKGWDAPRKNAPAGRGRVEIAREENAEKLYLTGVRNFPFKTQRPTNRRWRERHFTTLLHAYPRNYFARLRRLCF